VREREVCGLRARAVRCGVLWSALRLGLARADAVVECSKRCGGKSTDSDLGLCIGCPNRDRRSRFGLPMRRVGNRHPGLWADSLRNGTDAAALGR
jgi:hypothetical protein